MDKQKSKFRQKFDRYVPVYAWSDEQQKVVLLPQKKDQQAFIQSNEDCALDKILDKYGYDLVASQSLKSSFLVADTSSTEKLDLAEMGDYFTKAEEIRDKFNLSYELTADEVYQYAQKQVNDLINKYKGGNNLEKSENVAKSEQTQLSSNSNESE